MVQVGSVVTFPAFHSPCMYCTYVYYYIYTVHILHSTTGIYGRNSSPCICMYMYICMYICIYIITYIHILHSTTVYMEKIVHHVCTVHTYIHDPTGRGTTDLCLLSDLQVSSIKVSLLSYHPQSGTIHTQPVPGELYCKMY